MIRKLPTLLAAVFIVITTTRVGDFAQDAMMAGWLGQVFAIGMAAGVFVAATYNRIHQEYSGKETQKSADARRTARWLLWLLVGVETAFNLAEVNRVTDFTFYSAPTEWVATQIYGVFPSLVVMLLGSLQGKIDALPEKAGRYSIKTSVRRMVAGWADRSATSYTNVATKEPHQLQSKATTPPRDESVVCEFCGEELKNVQAYSVHKGRYCPKNPDLHPNLRANGSKEAGMRAVLPESGDPEKVGEGR